LGKGKRLAAFRALETLVALAILPELAGLGLAGWTLHGRYSGWHQHSSIHYSRSAKQYQLHEDEVPKKSGIFPVN